MADDADSADAKDKLVQNERLKARANYLNGLSVAVVAVGGLAPLASALSAASAPSGSAAAMVVICLAASYGLHFLAIRALGKLEP